MRHNAREISRAAMENVRKSDSRRGKRAVFRGKVCAFSASFQPRRVKRGKRRPSGAVRCGFLAQYGVASQRGRRTFPARDGAFFDAEECLPSARGAAPFDSSRAEAGEKRRGQRTIVRCPPVASPVITCTFWQVGRLQRALLLPTSDRAGGREACKPRADPASRIPKCGLKKDLHPPRGAWLQKAPEGGEVNFPPRPPENAP